MLGFENHIGKVSISDNYLTQIVRHAVTDCFGVSDVCNVDAFHSAVSALTFGKAFKNKKGVVKSFTGILWETVSARRRVLFSCF